MKDTGLKQCVELNKAFVPRNHVFAKRILKDIQLGVHRLLSLHRNIALSLYPLSSMRGNRSWIIRSRLVDQAYKSILELTSFTFERVDEEK